MKRKLVQQGSSTMMISLPSKWIKVNKLGKGNEIDLLEKDNKITISTEIKEKKEVIIDITPENIKDIKNILTHIYRRGFDKIILKSKEPLKEVKTVVSDFMLGFEITEISSEKIVIENISEPAGQKYDLILKQAFDIIEDTAKIIIFDFENNKFANLIEVEDLRKQQERFILFCRRLISKGTSEKNVMLHWELLTFLLHIEHRYEYLYKFVANNKIIKNKKIVEMIQETKRYFELYKKSYYNKDINAIHMINHLKKEYHFGKYLELLEKSKGKDIVIVDDIREILRLIQIGTSPILAEILENKI